MKKEYYVFGALALVLLLFFAYESYIWYGHTAAMGGMMQQMGHGMHALMGFPWTLFAFLLLLAVFVLYLMTQKEAPKDEAIAVLQKRYAGGEITREQYLQILRDIKEKE